MEKLLNYFLSSKFIFSLIVIAICFFIYFIINNFITNILNNKNIIVTKRKKTYLKLIKSISKYLILIICVIMVLGFNGINVTSFVAGLGLVSVIAGLALQDALKDIIMGFNLIVDNYFSVGDVLSINGKIAKVTEIGLKVTKLRDIYNDNIIVIANRNISEAITCSNYLDIDIPLPYEEKIEDIEAVIINKIINKIDKLENVEKVEYKGLNEFASSSINYKIRLFVKPENQPQTKRDANKIIKIALDSENISIPYTQIDIHNKK